MFLLFFCFTFKNYSTNRKAVDSQNGEKNICAIFTKIRTPFNPFRPYNITAIFKKQYISKKNLYKFGNFIKTINFDRCAADERSVLSLSPRSPCPAAVDKATAQ